MKKPHLFAAALGAALLSHTSGSSAADTPDIKFALSLAPLQSNVDFETPTGAEAASAKVEAFRQDGWSGWIVRGADGRLLRRFLDTNGDGDTDMWCYFKDGVEVYRDVDSDFDGKADQYRWLGTAGIRWGEDKNQDRRIDRWKSISAEEVSAELVAAIANADSDRFERLLISPEELKELGLGKEYEAKLESKRRQAIRDFPRFASEQKAIAPTAKWVHFAASMPGTIPLGTGGAEKDIVVYENAVAMYESSGETGQLIVGTLLKTESAWRLVDLPQNGAGDQSVAGFFFSGATLAQGDTPANGGISGDLQAFVTSLEKIDAQLRSASGAAAAKLHAQRADCLEGIIANCAPDQRASWLRQLVDTVGAAVQENAYPDGLNRLQTLSRKLADKNDDLQSYVDFQIISCDYAMRLSKVSNQADFPKVQEWWLTALEKFVGEHPRTTEAAQAMLQLGLSKEFEDNEKEAIQWYAKVANQFRDSEQGKKAAGAVSRLESVGRVIDLDGKTLDNKSFRISQLRGKPIVIHYWATWCEPCKQDMKLLRQLQARYQRAGLQIVGINVDGVRADAVRFVNETKHPWITLFAEGGLDSSPLANALGVQTLPTMLLIDKAGKVVRHNVSASQLDAEIEKIAR